MDSDIGLLRFEASSFNPALLFCLSDFVKNFFQKTYKLCTPNLNDRVLQFPKTKQDGILWDV
ncbi:hypothetical protein LCGC14_2340920 [marine sediment metagenome]|uniref:Uncharacterized protein n=1 Tax=marine sediment metagenome TaxID=412755 RepID=A0A0F9F760_9ZZZZ